MSAKGQSSPLIAAVTLYQGSWYAVEQCGRLLKSAVLICDSGDAVTGFALAMLAREELGRHKMLLKLAAGVEAGSRLTRGELFKEYCDHVMRHDAGMLSISFHCLPGEPIYEALVARDMAAVGSPHWHKANDTIEALNAEWLRTTPARRHYGRMSAMYVDISDDGQAWIRPALADAGRSVGEVNAAVNDYATALQDFDSAIAAAPDLQEWFPFRLKLQAHRPEGVHLPSPVWPRFPC